MALLQIQSLSSTDPGFTGQLERLLNRDGGAQAGVDQAVAGIIERIRQQGDAALLEFTREFDALELENGASLEIPPARIEQALNAVGPELRQALEFAVSRISSYHQRQRQDSWEYIEPDGTRLGQRITPLDRVGLYVPGGKAAYPSSVLMNAIPAKIAGVSEIIMTVPTPRGEISEAVLAAAGLAGVDRVFRIGGAQAVAALAYGTETVPGVDKIVGPGNTYVAAAKKLVFGQVGIDMIAGPSEVVVLCDSSVDPEWAAMDLFAQAEHDELAQSILISTEREVIDQVRQALASSLPGLERAEVVRAALAGQGALVLVRDLDEAAQVINRIAPEHLELMIADPERVLGRVKHAGAIFIGRHSAEALGDYCAGPNHVLPTSGTARFSSPLGVYDFQKRSSLIQCSPQAADELARASSVLARAESLTAHARSAEYRLKG